MSRKIGLPQPVGLVKDKGYAWLVMVMSFLSHFMQLGFSNSVTGVLTIVQIDYFNINLQTSTLIGSLHIASIFIFGPLASILLKRIGIRNSQLLGGSCAILGVGLSALSTESWHAFLLFSILAGFGLCMCYCSSSEILPFHFDKYLNLAFSFATMGAFVGSSVWPVLSQYLLETYGYSKAMGLMAATHIVHLIAGICFCQPQERILQDLEMWDNKAVGVDEKEEVEEKNIEVKDDSTKSEIFAISKVTTNNIIKEEQSENSQKPRKETSWLQLKQDYVHLLKSVTVWCIIFSGAAWIAATVTTYVLINDYVVTTAGLSVDSAAFGVTLFGIGRICGCGLLTLCSSLSFDRVVTHALSLGTFSTVTIIFAYINGQTMYYILSVAYGAGNGVTLATFMSVAHIVSEHPRQCVLLIGLEFFAAGIGTLAFPPLFVYIKSAAGNAYGLVSAGCFGLLGAASLIPIIVKTRKEQNIEGE